jgi:hypothetical protein
MPADSLVAFRAVLGLACCFWSMHYLVSGRASLLCEPRTFHFTWPGFEWVQPWPGGGMQIQFAVMSVAGLFFACGFLTHLSNFVIAFGITHFFLIDRTNYQNHYYLLILLSWSSLLLPLYRIRSLDTLFGTADPLHHIPRISLLLVQFHIALPYVFGGISKFDTDWLSGKPMRFLLMQRFGLESENFIALCGGNLLAWGGLIFDLLIVPGLLWRPTRTIAWTLLIAFHLTNAALFPIHIFPWLMIGLSTVFLPPNWPITAVRRLVSSPQHQPDFKPPTAVTSTPLTTTQKILSAGLICYCLLHVLWPLRAFVYTEPAGWTERGHYFAWRMMLRGKTTALQYYLTDPHTGYSWGADYSHFLHPEQALRFAIDPEMIRHLAEALADSHQSTTGIRPEVRALVLSSLNGRRPQLLIDPSVNLAAEPTWPQRRTWIMPLTEPLPEQPWQAHPSDWHKFVNLPPLPWQNPVKKNASTPSPNFPERNYAHGTLKKSLD